MEVVISLSVMVLVLGLAFIITRVAHKNTDRTKSVTVSKDFFEAAMKVNYALSRARSVSEKNAMLPEAAVELDNEVRRLERDSQSTEIKFEKISNPIGH